MCGVYRTCVLRNYYICISTHAIHVQDIHLYYMCEMCITGAQHMYYRCMNYMCNTQKHTCITYVSHM